MKLAPRETRARIVILFPDTVFLAGFGGDPFFFDPAIMGVVDRHDLHGVVTYDYSLCLELLRETGMASVDSIEWLDAVLDANTEYSPFYFFRVEDLLVSG